jgi:hypothetical protein
VSREEAAAMFQGAGLEIPPELVETKLRPRWDRNRRQLRYGETLCREYSREAGNQFTVLDAFEAAGWPQTIDSPWPKNESRLCETIRDLNVKLLKESLIRFRGSFRPEWFLVSSPA